MVSEAQKRASAKYKQKTYDRLVISFRKDADLTLAMVREHAAAHGESFGEFVRRVVSEVIAEDPVWFEYSGEQECKGGED